MYYVLCAIWAMATLKSEYAKYKKKFKNLVPYIKKCGVLY
jgi:hypothetical protein